METVTVIYLTDCECVVPAHDSEEREKNQKRLKRARTKEVPAVLICLSIYLPLHPSTYLSIYLFIYLSIHLSIYRSICLSPYLCIYLLVSVHLFIDLYVYM